MFVRPFFAESDRVQQNVALFLIFHARARIMRAREGFSDDLYYEAYAAGGEFRWGKFSPQNALQ